MLSLQQTDTPGPCVPLSYAVAEQWAQDKFAVVAEVGGDVGESFQAVTCVRQGIPGATAWGAVFACTMPDGYELVGGNWTVRIERGGLAFQTLRWTGIRIVRMSSACVVQQVLQEWLGFSIQCTPGVHELVVADVAGTIPDPGDHIGVMLRFTNDSPTSTQSISIRPTQLIDAPFVRRPKLLLMGVGK